MAVMLSMLLRRITPLSPSHHNLTLLVANRSGADKVSNGGDAVDAAQAYYASPPSTQHSTHNKSYSRSGADKVSIGGDAVDAAEAYYASC